MATWNGFKTVATTDRAGGLLIESNDGSRSAYLQPGDDANVVLAELEEKFLSAEQVDNLLSDYLS